jgi:bifunctional non-homologous end joining protein LigD
MHDERGSRPARGYEYCSFRISMLRQCNLASADIVIGGWLPGTGARSAVVGSVLAGIPGPAGLDYAGSVGSGFSAAELRDLTARLRQLEQSASPFAGPLPAAVARRARWTRPVLTAEVTYAEVTQAGRLRHPVWRGLRAG